MHPLKELVLKQKNNEAIGIYSACSSNEFVLKAVLKRAKQLNSIVLIEATANQVDQFGGYSGMKPLDFKNYIYDLAKEIDFDINNIILGGDHLGPLTFSKYDETKAMDLADTLIYDYVYAGFTKIHLDTSMKLLSDDQNTILSDEIIAKRALRLFKVAMKAYEDLKKIKPDAIKPVFIVGSEVPIPGGAISSDAQMNITKPADFIKTYNCFKDLFIANGYKKEWEDIIAFVVQPGVEEKDDGCVPYDRKAAQSLKDLINTFPNIIFEAHSTDYQTKEKLRELVEDGFAILKVGPGLSFAAREALFALANIEAILLKDDRDKQSNLQAIIDEEMLKNPKYWINHYKGDEKEISFKRAYSFSDRIRYYLNNERVKEAINKLFANLNEIPLSLLSQYMPIQYQKIREGSLAINPEDLVLDRIINTIDDYLYASRQHLLKK